MNLQVDAEVSPSDNEMPHVKEVSKALRLELQKEKGGWGGGR